MICGSLQCASVTGMALQGNMKSLLIVRSGNWSSLLLGLIDLFTFQRLGPTQKKNYTRQPGHQYFVVGMIFFYPAPSFLYHDLMLLWMLHVALVSQCLGWMCFTGYYTAVSLRLST